MDLTVLVEIDGGRVRTTVELRNGYEKNKNRYNNTYPKGGVSCSEDTFVQDGSSVLRMKFSGKIPPFG